MRKTKVSTEVQEEALIITKKIQKEGQTKEQTKLIVQGIQKGIAEYKKSAKNKQRKLDKYNKKMKAEFEHKQEMKTTGEDVKLKIKILPWVLLGLSWLGFITYLVYKSA
ncbi:MAG: DUF2956 domain-containing protein [Psychromonas sp.]|nr:DUF2956 domain-containing protein [Psychromonas sp.]